ncbi:MAG: PKD domain-containing protein [Nanoarchaeota archaeon]
MNFKTKFFIATLIFSVFLLSGCEVYQTLYGTAPKESQGKAETTQVIRLEGAQAKDSANLEKMAYATATPAEHDPFKINTNPLGPFPKGKPLGFNLGQWLEASGIGVYSVDDENAEMELSFRNLVPNGVYTVWCSRITFPPNPKIEDAPCGTPDGSENKFESDQKGSGSFSLKLKPLEASTDETASGLAVAYHSDGKTYGAIPGDFGMNTHVQLFFMVPKPISNATKFEVPIKFTNHIDGGFPEQDVFVELVEVMEKEEAPEEKSAITGEAAIEKPQPKEREIRKEVIIEKIPGEKPVVITALETELINLVPEAEDPDKDTNLVFTFTSPLNENGEWQTSYGDAGEYTITVTASDEESITTKEVLIILNRKEETPTIDSAKPIESGLAIDETQAIEFSVSSSDLNKDQLSYVWKLDGTNVGTDPGYTYVSTYEDSGTHTVKIDVSDSSSTASKIWSIDVKNINRKPKLEKIDEINAKETEKVTISLFATDDDKDTITYAINDKRFTQEDNVFIWQTDYDSAGTYKVTVSASDGQDVEEHEATINIENLNRPPVITDIVQKK